jgi:hypothetical protein
MNEPIIQSKLFNLFVWLLLIAVALGGCALFLRRSSPQRTVARLNAVFGPLLFACAWLYGVVFEPGNNFGAISGDGFWGYWFRPRDRWEMSGRYGQLALIAGVGIGLLLLFSVKIWRHRAEARGVSGPLTALAFWCVGSLTVYYVPWRLADILTNYTRFNSGIDDIGEFLSALVESGIVFAAIVGFGAMAVAWFLTARSFAR